MTGSPCDVAEGLKAALSKLLPIHLDQCFRLIYFLLRRGSKWVAWSSFDPANRLTEYPMISSRMTQEYRRMNSEDGSSFRQWLAINAVVGACLVTLIAIAAVFSDGNSKLANIARSEKAIQPAKTK